MSKKHSIDNMLGRGTLKESIVLERDEKMENPSLHIKLQKELAKPLNSDVRKESSRMERVGKLKPTETRKGGTLLS